MTTSILLQRVVLSAVCGLLLFSVAASGGGGAEVKSEVSTTSVGEQLMGLEKALDAGAMPSRRTGRSGRTSWTSRVRRLQRISRGESRKGADRTVAPVLTNPST
jgi:hypothetical protein